MTKDRYDRSNQDEKRIMRNDLRHLLREKASMKSWPEFMARISTTNGTSLHEIIISVTNRLSLQKTLVSTKYSIILMAMLSLLLPYPRYREICKSQKRLSRALG